MTGGLNTFSLPFPFQNANYLKNYITDQRIYSGKYVDFIDQYVWK